ncbi:MAG TPA: glycosyltransferase family 2 protein [Candidatus Elarobacter sp.]|nr:glycosyltransferase family 2 protein [Candidatus Elarobacter sp.]
MADDPLTERRDRLRENVLDGLTHVCALAALIYAERATAALRGWVRVPAIAEERRAAADDGAPVLSVVVPARNEERTIERCVRSLLAQTLAEYEVIVVDDRSDDRTPAILDRLAREHPRLRVVRGAPLPEGWVGKPWALAQGAHVARARWLLFTDADTWHAPHACASALAFARARGVDALSLWTRQELGSWGERAVLPSLLSMIVVASGSLERLNDPGDPEHALANGQYVLVSRVAHEALGGFEALRGEIVEDVAFARRLKADGRFRLILADGSELVAVRMYTSLRELWDGFSKNMYAGAGGDVRTLAAAAFFLALLSAVPAALAADAVARRRPLRASEALLCLAAGIAVQARAFRTTGIAPALAWFAPAGHAVTAAIVMNSTLRVLSGRGVEWRGRRYTGRTPSG